MCDVPGMQEPSGPFLSEIDADWVKLLFHVIISYETTIACVVKKRNMVKIDIRVQLIFSCLVCLVSKSAGNSVLGILL